MFHPPTSAGAIPLACCAALSILCLATPVCAQTAPDRSQDPAYSVYRWIKLHADTPRKADPPKVRPKPEPTAATARRPNTTAASAASGVQVQTADTPASPATPPQASAPVESAQATALPTTDATATASTAPTASPIAPPIQEAEEDLKLVEQTQPEFPRELRAFVAHGKVMLAFTVQPDGTVTEPSVVSATNRRLGKPALDAVTKWRFAPIRVARVAQVEIEFNLQ